MIFQVAFNEIPVNDQQSTLTDGFNACVNICINSFYRKYQSKLSVNYRQVSEDSSCSRNLENLLIDVELSESKIFVIFDEIDSFANKILTNENMKLSPLAMTDGLASSLNMVIDLSKFSNVESLCGLSEENVKSALQQCPDTMLLTTVDSNEGTLSFSEHHFNVMKNHYYGYRFNECQTNGIFNPQMVFYYILQLQLTGNRPEELFDPQMSSSNDLIIKFILNYYKNEKNFFEIIQQFLSKGFQQDVQSNITIDNLLTHESLISLAYYHGHLTHFYNSKMEDKTLLVSPNLEFQQLMLNVMKRNIDIPAATFESIMLLQKNQI